MMKKNRLTVLVGALIGSVLLAYMFAFQVRYDQVAVLTTFDKATQHAVKRDPGLYFKLPWPVQKVQRYSTRLRLLEHRLSQVSTNDGKSVVVQTYLVWRVDDPLVFFVNLQNAALAQGKLAPLLSEEISSTIGRYRMAQLVNTDQDQVKLAQIEDDTLKKLEQRLEALGYGVRAEKVGIRRLVLPQENTQQVFETMRQARQRLASNARVSGQARASAIISQANSASRRILAFAQRRAQAIRAKGDQEAAGYYSAFNQDEPLAIFLRRIQTLEKILPHNTTFVLDANQLSLQQLFDQQNNEEAPTPTPQKDFQESQDAPGQDVEVTP